MKKRILSAVLVSGVTLGTVATQVSADDFDSQISAKDAVISNLTADQAAAQAQVSSIQTQVSSLEDQQAELEAENAKLEAESQKLNEEIQALSSKIVARNDSLKKQARSAQKSGTATSYINTLLNSKSVSDAINRVVAIREVVSANEKMLAQQKADKASIEEKQAENQKAINTVAENSAILADNKAALTTKQAELQVAQLELASQLATAEEERANLVSQKAAAEEAARQAAAAEAAAKAQAEAEAKAQAESVAAAQAAVQAQETVTTETTTVQTPSVQAESSAQANTSSTQSTASSTTSSPTVTQSTTTAATTVSYSTSGNTYPVGQCTWGVKSLASWVGNNWGNANQWGASAVAAGHSTGSTPAVGAVIVWPYDGGGYGHVAYVTSVSGSNITVMESNYAGNMSIGNYRGTFNVNSSGSHYFIYQ
ncbi:peptidoglycan hydrolase PcsB [Streptococcus orisratti]|uniref:peptidoglycan hydrolase PcsB n=1 Tax=Streptococcus orisratti TaxID=114652 RepID=UPI00035E4E6F|nr:CHAP domain-containing protein [Streptococcus orisratti]MDY5635427.1 CHAP domain-containing protein [Streptococcus orisratti]